MVAPVEIRRAGAADAPSLAALHLRTALHAYAHIFPRDAPAPALADLVDDWTGRIAANGPAREACFVAVEQGEPVGVVIGGPDPGAPDRGHLSRFYVDPSCWQRGIGTSLHDQVIAHLRGTGYDLATLWVLEGNVRARHWYERLGWQPNGERVTTYAPAGIDDLGYVRTL